MGSLMAGWNSPPSDPNIEKYRRTKSLTREDIEAFWKSKKEKEEEHLKDITLVSPRTQKSIFEEAARRMDPDPETNLDKLIQKNGWWISSSLAFLNEPPVIGPEGAGRRYASQFHVAQVSRPDDTHGGA